MSKAVFIIATILISVVIASQAIEDNHHPHKHHKRQHSQSVVGQHNGHLPEHSKHHIQDLNKEKINHGQMPVPLAPHHSKSQRNGRRHKTSKSSKVSKNHHQQSKPNHHKTHQNNKPHGHGRKHH